MFNKLSVRRYIKKLGPALEKQYGPSNNYSASQVRTIVFKKDFNAKFLPLAYIMFLEKEELNAILAVEFPDLCLSHFEKTVRHLIDSPEVLLRFNTLKAEDISLNSITCII